MRKTQGWVALVALCVAGCEAAVTSNLGDGGDGGIVDGARSDATIAIDVTMATPDATAGLDATADDGPVTSSDDGATATPDDGSLTPDDGPATTTDVPDESCDPVTDLHDGDVLTGQHFDDLHSSLPMCVGNSSSTGPAHWYRASVPAGELLEVDVTREGGPGADFLVEALESCGAATCLAQAVAFAGTVSPLIYRNESVASRDVLVAVMDPIGLGGPVTVAAHVRTPAPNASCLTATPLTAGVTLHGQDIGRSVERLRSCLYNPTDTGSPALYYTITVPPRTALVATSQREDGVTGGPSNVRVEVRPPCGAPGCLATAFSGYSPAPTGQYNNASDVPQDVTVTIAASDAFVLPVTGLTATLRPLPANDQCAAAVTLADGVAVTIDHPEDATDATPRCPGPTGYVARARYYAVTVPAGQSVDVGVDDPAMPGTAGNAFVRLFTACGGACLAAYTDYAISPRVVYANGGASPRRLVVAAGTGDLNLLRPLTLRASLHPTAANVACAGAAPLAAGTTVEGIDLLEAQGTSPCGVGGPALYYAVPVAAGATLTLTAARPANPDAASPTLAVVDGCGGVCLAQDTGPTLGYVNRGAARTVVVALGQTTGAPITDLVTLSARVE